jgi:hypothetical protein
MDVVKFGYSWENLGDLSRDGANLVHEALFMHDYIQIIH